MIAFIEPFDTYPECVLWGSDSEILFFSIIWVHLWFIIIIIIIIIIICSADNQVILWLTSAPVFLHVTFLNEADFILRIIKRVVIDMLLRSRF